MEAPKMPSSVLKWDTNDAASPNVAFHHFFNKYRNSLPPIPIQDHTIRSSFVILENYLQQQKKIIAM